MSVHDKPLTLSVVAGIRSQFIKLAALQRAVADWNQAHAAPQVTMISINTGQHYDHELSGQFLRELDIKIDVDLTGTHRSHEPTELLAESFVQLHSHFRASSETSNWVIVFGDANATLAGALAANRAGLRVCHVEAGLRTGDLSAPEEVNRVIADHIASRHFASTYRDLDQLNVEGLGATASFAGDLVRDLVANMPLDSFASSGVDQNTIVLTLHREETLRTGSLDGLLEAVSDSGRPVLFVTHPRTRETLERLASKKVSNVRVTSGLQYGTMLRAVRDCAFLVTDSGALQRESYYLGKRAVVVQDRPYWASLVDAGFHVASPPVTDALRSAILDLERLLHQPRPTVADFGEGSAGQNIISGLVQEVR